MVFFFFTESWLSNDIMSTELGFHNYDICRLDRMIQTSLLSRGDGVLITVRNNLHSKLIMVENKHNEMFFVLLKMSNLTFNFGIVYIPNK